mmetsp:Transcript_1771/g.4051  ORF Transcript_1771/g.4051 Transcript_1771/m.4051 type:complete len:208 (+) Transcript_1771:292-915(+)
MFSLVSGLLQQYFEKREVRFLMIGLDGAGKTSLLERTKLCFNNRHNPINAADTKEFEHRLQKVSPTVGLNIGRLEIKGTKVIMWDLGGQESLRGIWDKYFPDASGIVWVIDSTNPDRMEEAKQTLQGVLQTPDLDGVPLLVFANKSDLPGAAPEDDIRKLALPADVSNGSRHLRVVAASALEDRGVSDGVGWLLSEASKHPRPRRGD